MNNSEILFLYDAKMANPNGDPDEENRPRMDYEREINLVSDLRLKRYIRDYLENKGERIFVTKLEDKSVKPEKIIDKLKVDLNKNKLEKEDILNALIDVRLFGATMPIEGNTRTFTGPVQFNWGYSLNKVELVEAAITSHFSTDEKNNQGAMGRDYRVKYSFIAFSGVISGNRANHTLLKEEDIKKLDAAIIKAIPQLATRSKVGQYPRLYLRVEYNDSETILGDMRSFIKLDEKIDNPRDISEVALDISNLKEHLVKNIERIKNIYYYVDHQMKLIDGEEKEIVEIFKAFDLIELR
ncbi:type I-B CRISPR-associated protein Cas7/Csh2 [Paramaledivibacter caminithermalis]|jgi:CRISPR-associated protein Csh2|uniref:CRISPR-associated protein, Csh2 family n=1 Tax=Paramaledivibacter caminithermalis (strain DSM 15212 / CIP 107654 / DViRD3) TaxID=1121301 RepID=A0A1M6KPM1_PARC5|nr:type I-B CRISPR-associated protein Cas7/Csh2 [Paramaledivibacter caminithermalis]SHJ60841.1 CRISPR-associated protein, Csh2 family [Paramaledivibacter caminithermalis DSM 15212]